MAIQSREFRHVVGNQAGTVFEQEFVTSSILRRDIILKQLLFTSFRISVFNFIVFEANMADVMPLRSAMPQSEN